MLSLSALFHFIFVCVEATPRFVVGFYSSSRCTHVEHLSIADVGVGAAHDQVTNREGEIRNLAVGSPRTRSNNEN